MVHCSTAPYQIVRIPPRQKNPTCGTSNPGLVFSLASPQNKENIATTANNSNTHHNKRGPKRTERL